MRTRVTAALALLLSTALGPTAGVSTQQQQAGSLPDTWLEGVVGQAAVRVFIGNAGYPKEEGLWGMYYYTKYWTAIPLDGEFTAPGRVRFLEGDPDTDGPKPRFDLDVSGSGPVAGTWTSADGRQKLPVRLQRVPKPPPFDVAIRQTRTFSHPNWPMAFVYPASWRLDVRENELTLQSPDPEDMMFDNQLHCERGAGLPPAPQSDDKRELFKSSFYRARKGWLVESSGWGLCAEDASHCAPPASRPLGSATLMRAEVGYRSRVPWGYAGIGDATEYLIVDGEQWVHCFDRALDSDTRIQPARRRASGGNKPR